MEKIKIFINNKEIVCLDNQTILEVAKQNNIYIPTLCHLKNVCSPSACRVCMVLDQKNNRLVTACSTIVTNKASYLTNCDKVTTSIKNTLSLIYENHHKNCIECTKNENCALQKLFHKYGFYDNHKFNKYDIDKSSPCIIRNNNKCILCGRCVNICKNLQSVSALTKINRGPNTKIGCSNDSGLKDSTCVGCGACTLVCPTGALTENNNLKSLINLLNDKSLYVTCQVAPSVRVSLAEMFGEPIGTFDEGRMVKALSLLGFKKVFDINLGADITVIEEANELLSRLENKQNIPLFSSCCPAWFKYVQTFYPEFIGGISSCKSPTEMLGAVIKNYYTQKENIDRENIKVIGIMPCTAKKGERERADDVDVSITTRELYQLIKMRGIDYLNLKNQKFDTPFSTYSGGALIFGVTGGVTEAVLRYVAGKIGGDNTVSFEVVRNSTGRKEVEVSVLDKKLHICVVNGLNNAKSVLEDIKNGKKHFDFVEVMACPGGCVNGGGQAYVDYYKTDIEEVKKLRANSLYNVDSTLSISGSHQNLDVEEIYKAFLIPNSDIAKKILHYKHN